MAGIGADIAEVMQELGDTAIILRTPTNLTEKISLDSNWSTTSSFVRDFMLNASLAHNTLIVSGDLLQVRDGIYLVTDKIVDTFEGSIVEYAAAIYKCNIPSTALFLEPTVTTDPVTFVTTHSWNIRKSSAPCLVYKNARGAINEEGTVTGKDLTFKLDCFVPSNYGIKPLDRLYINADEYYRVQDIEKYAFEGVDILTLVNDERLVYTP